MLDKNKIRIIEFKAFSLLNSLTQLNLANQYLTHLNDFSFCDLNALTSIDLQNNKVSLIKSSNVFYQLPKLVEINLRNNSLTKITNTWSNLYLLKYLYLENNPIEFIQK